MMVILVVREVGVLSIFPLIHVKFFYSWVKWNLIEMSRSSTSSVIMRVVDDLSNAREFVINCTRH